MDENGGIKDKIAIIGTGVRMIVELTRQVLDKAEGLQVKTQRRDLLIT